MKSLYRKYELAFLLASVPIIILVLRFEDIRGSYFLSTIDFCLTNGEIIESKIIHGHKPNYRFKILYKYEVDGVNYTNSRVGFGFKGSNSKANITEILNKYPVGASVQVHFDTRRPKFSVLEPERNSRNDFYIVLFLCVAGILFSIIVLKRGITKR